MINNQPPVFFTIVAKNYIAYARTLCASIAAHHPDAKIYVGLSDSDIHGIDQADDCFELISVNQLDLPNLDHFAFRYDVMEFSTAIKPYVFRWLLANTATDCIIYLDPDILVLSPLAEVLYMLRESATAILTPHLITRVDDGYEPDERTMLRVGIYNLGFLAISRCNESKKLLDWWCDRLEYGAVVDLENGLFTDQKWADHMPALFDGVAIFRNPGYNVAYWNLMHRAVSQVNGIWVANGQPIRFFHFSGIDPSNPRVFSKHQNRYALKDIGELQVLYAHYIALLGANGYFETVNTPYGYGCLADGTRIHGAMRTYFRKFLDTGDTVVLKPFTSLNADYFNVPEKTLTNNALVTRFMYGLYVKQKELQAAFDLNLLEDQEKFARWFVLVAAEVYKVDDIFIKAADQRLIEFLNVSQQRQKNPGEHWLRKIFINAVLFSYRISPRVVRSVARILPDSLVAGVKVYAMRGGFLNHKNYKSRLLQKGRYVFEKVSFILKNFKLPFKYRHSASDQYDLLKPSAPFGVTLIGYPRGDFGVAQNLRAVAKALQTVQLPFDIYEAESRQYSNNNNSLAHLIVENSPYAIQLSCVNADVTPQIFAKLDDGRPRPHCRIGYWFWELADFPKAWLRAFDDVDEVWAPSRFIFETLSKVTHKPVIHMPVVVEFKIQGSYSRAMFQMDENKYLFFFSYDFHSYSQRKNPEAVISAFLLAFPKEEMHVGLVIKTSYADQYPEEYSKLLELALSDPRIKVIDSILSRDEMYGLIDMCDCYVSLHRAEGFGLGLAEAMFLGKPVIATGYSGNMDFMNADNSCIVDYQLVPVPEEAYPFWQQQVWAEPDIQQAAWFMRKLYNDEEYRSRIGANGKLTIFREHSSAIVGERMHDRLSMIFQNIS